MYVPEIRRVKWIIAESGDEDRTKNVHTI